MPTILLIEDDFQAARLVVKVLEPHGYKVIHEATGYGGLRRVRETDLDLVLLDMKLPDIRGSMVAVQMHTSGAGKKKFPVVAFTAESGDRARRLAMEFGCDHYICKPINTRTFPDEIRAVIEKFSAPPAPFPLAMAPMKVSNPA